MLERQVRHLPELRFSIIAEPDEYLVHYRVCEMGGWTQDPETGKYDQPQWVSTIGHLEGHTSNLEEAATFLHGHVKWDGCSNWDFDIAENTMLHECDREGLERIGEVLALCWDWTSELCPNWYPQ